MKTLLLYAYCDAKEIYRNNLRFFIKHGIFPDYDKEYIIIVNGHELTVDIPNYKNIKIIKRDNIGFDFGAWSEGLKSIKDIKEYDYFIFLNSSITGPFLPSYLNKRDFQKPFIDLINEKVKLVGITINDSKLWIPHVQSMFLVTDNIGLSILNKHGIFQNNNETDITQVIIKREIGCSKAIFLEGYEIDCISRLLKGRIYKLNGSINKPITDDICYPNCFLGYTLEPLDTIFFKSNRGMSEENLKRYIKIQDYEYENLLLQNPFHSSIEEKLNWLENEFSIIDSFYIKLFHWLVCTLNPKIIVNYNSQFINNSFSMCFSGIGEINYFIEDKYKDNFVEYYNEYILEKKVYKNVYFVNKELIKTEKEKEQQFNNGIDILYLNEVDENTFYQWKKFLKPGGIIIISDIHKRDSETELFYSKLNLYNRIEFTKGNGLAILSSNSLDFIKNGYQEFYK